MLNLQRILFFNQTKRKRNEWISFTFVELGLKFHPEIKRTTFKEKREERRERRTNEDEEHEEMLKDLPSEEE